MDNQLKIFEEKINNFIFDKVNLESVLELKNISEEINSYEKNFLWDKFIQDDEFIMDEIKNILNLDSTKFDKKDKPINFILQIKSHVKAIAKMETRQEKNNEELLEKLKKLDLELTKLFIKYEDLGDEISDQTYYLYNLIDEKFAWLDTNQEFIQISELLDEISSEIKDGVINIIDSKRNFYIDYFSQKFKQMNTQDISFNGKIYMNNFIKNYIMNNFNDIFNGVCLDVLEKNKIIEENQMKHIISLYYDYTKNITRLNLSLSDLDIRIDNTN